MGEFDDIIPDYIAESSELLETVEDGFLKLEQGSADQETVHTVFRAIHSIKGGAGFVGLIKIERLAHKMEDLLNLVRNGDLEPGGAVTDALIQSLDVLMVLFQRVEEHPAIDIDGPIRALSAALEAGAGEPVKRAMASVGEPAPDSGVARFEVTVYELEKKLKQGNLFQITLDMAQVEERGLTPLQLVEEMLSMGEIVDSQVDLMPTGDTDTYEVEHVCFQVLYSTVLESDLVEAALKVDAARIRQLGEADFVVVEDHDRAWEAPLVGAEPQPLDSEFEPEFELEPESEPEPEPEAPTAAPAAEQPARIRAAEPASAPPAPRAAQDAAPAPVPAPEPPADRNGEYLILELGRETYGVDILSVQEIIGMPELTRLPLSPEYMLGVVNLRGMVVPVLDLRRKLGLEVDDNDDPVVVVILVGEKVMGAVVDGVSDVTEIAEDQVQDPPEFAGPVRREYLRGLCRYQEEMVILLEMDRLLEREAVGHAA